MRVIELVRTSSPTVFWRLLALMRQMTAGTKARKRKLWSGFIIDAYNAEQNRATIEKTFMDLMELASSLDTEQQRYVREGFSSDEELSVYDLLFSENLTKQEIETIKKVSVDLLTKIKQQIAKLDHWTDKQETKAIVDNLIRNTLWQELPNSYDVSDIQTCQKKIYEYVYMRYPEVA